MRLQLCVKCVKAFWCSAFTMDLCVENTPLKNNDGISGTPHGTCMKRLDLTTRHQLSSMLKRD